MINRNIPNQEKNPYQNTQRPIPLSDLDFELMTINTEWGGQQVPPAFQDNLIEEYIVKDKDGKDFILKVNLWQLLGFYTRDMRLGNLNRLTGEVEYCRYYLDLANDFLQFNPPFKKPFLICLSRAANVLETSQSVNGFLRRRINTLTHENFQQNTEAPKKNFFGGVQKTGGNQ
jgi:hypothetical protein